MHLCCVALCCAVLRAYRIVLRRHAPIPGLTTANANIAMLMADLKKVQAVPQRGPATRTPAVSCSTSPCAPSVQAGGEDSSYLELVAPSGGVVVKTGLCEPIDLCDLSRDVQALLGKFGDQ